MKKWLFGLLLFVSTSLFGLPLGNPAESSLFCEGIFGDCDALKVFGDYFSLRAGYYGDFVFNRKMRIDGDGSGTDHNLSTAKIYTNAGYLVLNFCELADFFATFGETRLTLETNGRTWFSGGNYSTVIKSKQSFSWSIGSRFEIYRFGCFLLGFEGQYFTAYCDVDSYIELETSRLVYPHNHSTYREWQLGTGLSYKTCLPCSTIIVLPYVGVKWGRCKYMTHNLNFINTIPDPVTIFNTKSRRTWGVPLGVTVLFNRSVSLDIEMRWLDERAFSAKAQMQF